jgi:sec-independent protein translocase protein TatA
MFGNLGFGELMIILVIVLVLFGAKRIPEISASFGKGIREFKKNVNDVEGSIMGSGTNDVAPPRYDSRLPAPDPLARRDPVTPAAEERPEPKRLL